MSIRNEAVAGIVNSMIRSGKSSRIYPVLIELGVTACVAAEWANEPNRRASLLARRMRRMVRERASKFGSKRQTFRRIIFTELRLDGREWYLHATKGWRSRWVHAVEPQLQPQAPGPDLSGLVDLAKIDTITR